MQQLLPLAMGIELFPEFADALLLRFGGIWEWEGLEAGAVRRSRFIFEATCRFSKSVPRLCVNSQGINPRIARLVYRWPLPSHLAEAFRKCSDPERTNGYER